MSLAVGLAQTDTVDVQNLLGPYAAPEAVALPQDRTAPLFQCPIGISAMGGLSFLTGTQSTISCQKLRKQPMAMRLVAPLPSLFWNACRMLRSIRRRFPRENR